MVEYKFQPIKVLYKVRIVNLVKITSIYIFKDLVISPETAYLAKRARVIGLLVQFKII